VVQLATLSSIQFMRILGYILLIIGFGAINWKVMQGRDIIYGAALEQPQGMAQQTYSSHDVQIALIRATHETWDRSAPWLYGSGAIIFIGGILIDIGARRRKVIDHAP
jgi:hypothetical protein